MHKFVVLLRGINVSGVKVLMSELTQLLLDSGFTHVRTVLATGNVILASSEPDTGPVRDEVAKALEGHYGRCIPVLVYRAADFLELAESFPLRVPESSTGQHRYLTFTESPQTAQAVAIAAGKVPEPLARKEELIYWITPKGSSTTGQLASLLARQAAKHLMTTRNFNTVEKVAEILRASAQHP